MAGASALASARVMALSAPLEAMYAVEEPIPITPEIDEMLTMEPAPCFFIADAQARIIWYGPIRLTA